MPDGAEQDAPGEEREFTPPSKHVAADRFATGAIRSAQAITDGLAEAGTPDEDPVVIDRRGPRHSLAALDRLLSSALEVEAEAGADARAEAGAEESAGTADGEISPEDPPPAGR
ncbi:hypothetical protein [Actinomycetospora sp. TBRC 11914]|uniref:hypothetical protein n=1 Tax=Actinomycetospora sp. TBRC 11914 TaxID=2729387 RepID=UPI00145F3BC2|nr:hypothetical protein [Actinomycetospora sp. TBRC 11914]NMO89437.1 hypothetical protein [Actinomycetospora sp. TBRC 11914]